MLIFAEFRINPPLFCSIHSPMRFLHPILVISILNLEFSVFDVLFSRTSIIPCTVERRRHSLIVLVQQR